MQPVKDRFRNRPRSAGLQARTRSTLVNDPRDFDPLDFEGLRLDPASFDETVKVRAQAETMLKESQWAHNFASSHFGSPDGDFGAQQRFIEVGPVARSRRHERARAMHPANELNWFDPHLGSRPFPLATDAGGAGDFKTPIEQGPVSQTLTLTIDEPGRYTFVCDVHSQMTGTIEVTGSLPLCCGFGNQLRLVAAVLWLRQPATASCRSPSLRRSRSG